MEALRWAAATAAALLASAASAVQLTLWHAYGEFVDRGEVSAGIYVSDISSRIDCGTPPSVERTANRVLLSARKARSVGDPSACVGAANANLGEFAAGDYDVVVRLHSADGATFEEASQPMRIDEIAGRCNATPFLTPALIVLHRTMTARQLADRVASDPDFAARLGAPVVFDYGIEIGQRSYALFAYPPLHDPTVEVDRLTLTGEFSSIARNGQVCLVAPPPDDALTFVEFYNAGLDHYFYSGSPSEIAAIEAGDVGPGWRRTGQSFRAIFAPGCALSTPATVVYRFFGVPGRGPNSHFFTRNRAECHAVDASGQWLFEGIAFWAAEPAVDGSCSGANETALYRVWRPFGDSNHRFTTDRAIVRDTVARGWVEEGVAMCVLRE